MGGGIVVGGLVCHVGSQIDHSMNGRSGSRIGCRRDCEGGVVVGGMVVVVVL